MNTRFTGVCIFGLLAVAATLFCVCWPYLGPFLFLATIPLWLLFVVYLVRVLRP